MGLKNLLRFHAFVFLNLNVGDIRVGEGAIGAPSLCGSGSATLGRFGGTD
jgi:hypothetical protein